MKSAVAHSCSFLKAKGRGTSDYFPAFATETINGLDDEASFRNIMPVLTLLFAIYKLIKIYNFLI